MATVAEIKAKIEKFEKGLGNKNFSENEKKFLEKALTGARKQLSELEDVENKIEVTEKKIEVAEKQAKATKAGSHGKKAITAAVERHKTTAKQHVATAKGLKTRIDALLDKSKTIADKYKGSGVNLEHDARRQALPPGKRVSKEGNVYYENRANRSDIRQNNKYPKLAKGGNTITNPTALTYNGKNCLTNDEKRQIQNSELFVADNGTNIEFLSIKSYDSSGVMYVITVNGHGLWATGNEAKAKEFYAEEIEKYKTTYADGGELNQSKGKNIQVYTYHTKYFDESPEASKAFAKAAAEIAIEEGGNRSFQETSLAKAAEYFDTILEVYLMAKDDFSYIGIVKKLTDAIQKFAIYNYRIGFKIPSELIDSYVESFVDICVTQGMAFAKGGNTITNPTALTYNGKNCLTNDEKRQIQNSELFVADNGTNIEFLSIKSYDSSGVMYVITVNGHGLWATGNEAKAKEFYAEEIEKYKTTYAKGGSITNNYEGKTAAEVWDALTVEQRKHFVKDHMLNMGHEGDREQFWMHYKGDFASLPERAKEEIEKHVAEGQYAKGGHIGFKGLQEKVVAKVKAKKVAKKPSSSGQAILKKYN